MRRVKKRAARALAVFRFHHGTKSDTDTVFVIFTIVDEGAFFSTSMALPYLLRLR
jgi:hypothetical protein